MILAIECAVLCAIFTLVLISMLRRNPVDFIMSYPPAIRRRVESLPQYADVIKSKKRRHISAKIVSALVLAGILATVAYFSGAKNFTSAFVHVFILFFTANMYDLIILDLLWFCHSKTAMIPGTEDMVTEYKSPWHHVRGAVIGLGIGTIVSLMSGALVSLVPMLFG